MSVITLGPDVNCQALIDFADRKRVPQARHCEGCGSTHHPRQAPGDGARYWLHGRWLCAACYAVQFWLEHVVN